jgi:hypothetical protein
VDELTYFLIQPNWRSHIGDIAQFPAGQTTTAAIPAPGCSTEASNTSRRRLGLYSIDIS